LRKRIAIIGAGVSGLAAAVELFLYTEGEDLEVTIFESRREAGGRTRSFIDAETGDTLDNGQHLLMGCYTSTIDYLKTIGSFDKLDIPPSLVIPYYVEDGEEPLKLSLPKFIPAPLHLLIGVFRSSVLGGYEKAAAIRLGKDILLFKDDKFAKNLTCAQFFAKTKQPETLVEKMWEPIVLGTMNAPINKASAQVFINILRLIFFHDKRYSKFLFPKVGLSELLVAPALEYLAEHKTTIKYGVKTGSIKSFNNLAYVYDENGDTIDVFDGAIDAATSYTSDLPMRYSPIINAYLWTDKKLISSPICGFIGTNLHWCFAKPSKYSAQMIACTTSAGDDIVDVANDEIAEMYWKEIQERVPGAKYAKLLHSQIIKEKRATVLLTPELQNLRPHVETEDRNIFLAGDLAQNALPMTIEGSVRNGQKAAQKLADYLFAA
jgi:squalene-associated FAD-dependent desaturase